MNRYRSKKKRLNRFSGQCIISVKLFKPTLFWAEMEASKRHRWCQMLAIPGLSCSGLESLLAKLTDEEVLRVGQFT